MKTYLYGASNLKFSFIAKVNFWRPSKTIASCGTLFIGLQQTTPPISGDFF